MNRRQDLIRRQTHGALAVCMLQKERMGKRLAATRKLFGRKVLAVDIHSHSTYSDGCSTVAENVARATGLSGLDFLFCTDHETLAQRRSAGRLARAGLGEESFGGRFHVGLLCPSKLHKGSATVAEAVASARRIAPFVWVAHPVGFSGQDEPENFEKTVTELAAIDRPAIEVMNGFTSISRVYPRTGIWGVRLMDRLLQLGKRVTPLAGSDAHGLVEFGGCWTGVFAARREAGSIARALDAGRCFASEAPLLDFTCNGKRMGESVRVSKGRQLRLRFRVADAYGLAWVRIVSGGKTIKEFRIRGDKVFEGQLVRKAGARRAYYRLETVADDDRRAFSSPIYVGP